MATLARYISCLLIMPVSGSLVSEWLQCLAVFKPTDKLILGSLECQWLLWLHPFPSLLTVLVLDSPVCEWLLWLNTFHAC